MHEILRQLKPGDRVLDLGCDLGSFRPPPGVTAVRVDLEHHRAENFVQADAARLPFAAASFHAVVSNHSLEHITALHDALREIRRVLKPEGAVFVAVPDSSTITDIVYRWLARGGGHVNAFDSPVKLAGLLERETGLKLAGRRTLCTSLSFLNRRNRRTRAPRKLILLGGGREGVLRLATRLFRALDRRLGTRTSIYGWAFYLGAVGGQVASEPWTNVCVGCGAGHPSRELASKGLVRRRFGAKAYRCPACGTANYFTLDEHYGGLE